MRVNQGKGFVCMSSVTRRPEVCRPPVAHSALLPPGRVLIGICGSRDAIPFFTGSATLSHIAPWVNEG